MKKLSLLLIAAIGMAYTAAWNLPGFWGYVPPQAKEK